MGVYIKGMEMPTSCYVCPFCDYVSARCDAVKGNPYTPESRYEKRADFCPLVPVPSHHGRLIDADALMQIIREHDYPLKAHFNSTDNGMFTIGIQQAVDEAPTIIEADPTEEIET